MWNVVIYNDDYTPMGFVEFVLKNVFHTSTLDALALTLVVHTKGKAILYLTNPAAILRL
jgi:ATP-dependent Clp protease adaptor protein ClpS